MDISTLSKRGWWVYLEPDVKELVKESVVLMEKVGSWQEKFHDYSFVVFPAAKAYEGFLKSLFLEKGFISKEDYFGKRFRIGRALNPSLDRRYRKKESVYDRLVESYGSEELASRLWETWKSCRNLLFHWFPEEKNAISYPEARESVFLILDTMDDAHNKLKTK
jgi:hypothetical protein